MIGHNGRSLLGGFTTRLEALALAIAAASIRTNTLAARGDAARWRDATLLWPTFTGG